MTGLVRHMTVLKETGQPGDVRALESYNMQGNYIRHYNYQARNDKNVSPVEDSKLRIVPGLADASAISFESVNFPGYYLRHKNDLIYLEKNDGSSAFTTDATFRRKDGLANAAWTSYASYNYTDRYLRHYNNLLRLDPIVTTIDKSDATFKEDAK
ncbi:MULTISPECIES: AbfB domain-containing protein [unclassified Paenibacillus]|uniref:AbfB domain-containing protein n=1 Tax=unclassified Paenibacillus TaxID=185978 RepID=UPI0024B958F7|nr:MULTISPECIES: AbfB domain-containing protein [unclassified Paenibacillus]